EDGFADRGFGRGFVIRALTAAIDLVGRTATTPLIGVDVVLSSALRSILEVVPGADVPAGALGIEPLFEVEPVTERLLFRLPAATRPCGGARRTSLLGLAAA